MGKLWAKYKNNGVLGGASTMIARLFQHKRVQIGLVDRRGMGNFHPHRGPFHQMKRRHVIGMIGAEKLSKPNSVGIDLS